MENANLLREALNIPAMQQVFGKSGLEVLEDSDKLKVAPKNVPRDHPEIDLLRYKSLTICKTFSDTAVVSAGFLDEIMDVLNAAVPFVTVLNEWAG